MKHTISHLRVLIAIAATLLSLFPEPADSAGETRLPNGAISAGAISVGTSSAANSKAILDLVSTTKGLLPPRMTTTQKNNISSPTTGLTVFDSTLGAPGWYDGSAWRRMCSLDGTETLTGKSMSGASNTFTSIPNSATTAASANTASAIVARDGSGNFSAGTITATFSGTASLATALVSDPSDCAPNTYATSINSGANLTCGSITNAATTATNANTASAIVARDGSGNFSAGTITASLVGKAYLAYSGKTGSATLTDSEMLVGYDTSGGSYNNTFPSAAGRSGQRFTVVKITADGNTVTLLTSASQTISGKASGAIILTKMDDYITVESDGSNWVVISQNFHETLSAVSAIYSFSDGGTDADYGQMTGNSLPLTYGCWDVTQVWTLSTGTAGSGVFLYSGTGLYGANGDNGASAPTALSVSSSTGIKNYSDVQSTFGVPNSSTANLRLPIFTMLANICVTSSTTVYAVPRIGFTTASSASTYVQLFARRTK